MNEFVKRDIEYRIENLVKTINGHLYRYQITKDPTYLRLAGECAMKIDVLKKAL